MNKDAKILNKDIVKHYHIKKIIHINWDLF